MRFVEFLDGSGRRWWVPDDVKLVINPLHPSINSLIELPWDDKFLSHVPHRYVEFFTRVLPHMQVRSTAVHVACIMQFVDAVLPTPSSTNHADSTGEPSPACVDRDVVTVSLILHDIGWSKLSHEEIASSLGVRGLTLTPQAMGPKLKHAVEGASMARELLESHSSLLRPLSALEKERIVEAVLMHDRIEEIRAGKFPTEYKYISDIDHLWSFHHINFWQDTIRKGIEPQQYLNNLQADMESYFVTENGLAFARQLLSERRAEVTTLQKQTSCSS